MGVDMNCFKKQNSINRELLSDSGQAIFELIVFMPFFIYLITVFFNIGDSINSSINQQKAVRGYHFFLLKGNSTAPDLQGLQTFKNDALDGGSMVVTGWQEKTQGNVPMAPCFKFSSVFAGAGDETCETPTEEGEKSKYIRVFTVFGICGASYIKGGLSDFYIRKDLLFITANPFKSCARI